MELDEVDKEEFPIREAVLVVIVQRRFLKLSPDRGFVRTIESSVVSSFMSLPDNGYSNCPQFLKLRLLVPRALLLDNPFETRSPGYKEIDSEPVRLFQNLTLVSFTHSARWKHTGYR